MNIKQVEEKILGYVQESLGKKVERETPLISNGLLDSFSLLSFISFIENEFGIAFALEEMMAEHFESVTSASALINKKLAEK